MPIPRTKAFASRKPLPRSFYEPSAETVARNLLGKVLLHKHSRTTLAGRIVEVEAYLGDRDPAAHAFAGVTARNAVLFGPPGHAYVYFIYGMYYCLNFSCQHEGHGGGVLLRALEPLEGLETMAELRGLPPTANPKLLTSGPGRLCQALGITRAQHNGADLTSPGSSLKIVDDGFDARNFLATPRVGIRKAVDWPLRFLLPENPYVSGRRIP